MPLPGSCLAAPAVPGGSARSGRKLHSFEGVSPVMEKLLQKMARQLDSLDEASLMALWEKYAGIVSRFEPTKRWEESALVFALIQAKRWKNQAFNYNWSQQKRPEGNVAAFSFALEHEDMPEPAERKRASVLQFRPRQGEGKTENNHGAASDSHDTPTGIH